jgi:ABC-type antimicrobial peptide transport system permease subunit
MYSPVNSYLVLLIGTVSLLLASIGMYGVISNIVAQRTHEIGIRMALGAHARDVYRLLFRHGFTPVAAGLVGGLITSASVSGLLRGLLFGVSPVDLWTVSAVIVSLLTVTTLAITFPARRAARIDPQLALRCE